MIREAVQILLERAEDHPEEFLPVGRFHWVYKFACDETHSFCLSSEERKKIREAVERANYRHFHNNVMKTVLHAE